MAIPIPTLRKIRLQSEQPEQLPNFLVTAQVVYGGNEGEGING